MCCAIRLFARPMLDGSLAVSAVLYRAASWKLSSDNRLAYKSRAGPQRLSGLTPQINASNLLNLGLRLSQLSSATVLGSPGTRRTLTATTPASVRKGYDMISTSLPVSMTARWYGRYPWIRRNLSESIFNTLPGFAAMGAPFVRQWLQSNGDTLCHPWRVHAGRK